MKKGFTLIELLSVIVILAIIVLIATPIVLNIINDTKLGATTRSCENYLKAVEFSITKNMLNNKSITDGIYLVNEKGNIEVLSVIDNPIKINTNKTIYNYKIYGNSIINSNSILQSVGERTVNLFKDTSIVKKSNVNYENGVVTQVTEDTNSDIYFKLVSYKDSKYVSTISIKPVTSPGKIYFNFAKDNTFNEISFGVNGSARDSVLISDVSMLENGKTYTLSYNILNITQGNISWTDIQIEEGTVATNYEPYGYKILIKIRGKNLLNLDTVKDNNNYISSWDGSETVPSTNSSNWRSSDFIPVIEEKEYCFNANSGDANSAGIAWYNEDKNYISGLSATAISETNGKFVAPLGARYLRVSWRIDGEYNSNWQSVLQLEQDESTNYESYKEETFNIYLDEPLRKVGDYVDYIDFVNQKIYRNVEMVDDKLVGLDSPQVTDIELPNIALYTGINYLEIDTRISPSKVEIKYYK